jgi:hypothetical protein
MLLAHEQLLLVQHFAALACLAAMLILLLCSALSAHHSHLLSLLLMLLQVPGQLGASSSAFLLDVHMDSGRLLKPWVSSLGAFWPAMQVLAGEAAADGAVWEGHVLQSGLGRRTWPYVAGKEAAEGVSWAAGFTQLVLLSLHLLTLVTEKRMRTLETLPRFLVAVLPHVTLHFPCLLSSTLQARMRLLSACTATSRPPGPPGAGCLSCLGLTYQQYTLKTRVITYDPSTLRAPGTSRRCRGTPPGTTGAWLLP